MAGGGRLGPRVFHGRCRSAASAHAHPETNVRNGMPYILGLTGNIASGKTTVGLLLLELGADIYIDADRVVHELYLPGQPLVAELAGVFGSQIVDQAGGIDRKILGQIVFGNPTEMR